MQYVTEEEYAAVVAAHEAMCKAKAQADSLRAKWREHGSNLTLAQKLEALKAVKGA